MKGSFNIRVRRNNQELKLQVNNKVLYSGMKFNAKYSVSDSTSSIITHLILGSTHSDVLYTTTRMDTVPVAAVPYTDYTTPNFDNEQANVFVNKLSFRYVPTETVTIRQLATGRVINTETLNHVDHGDGKWYDFYSMANILNEDGTPGELLLYPGDIVDIDYELTIFGGYYIGSNNNVNGERTDADHIWNIVRANPNWHLCGYDRRFEIALAAINVLWDADPEAPFQLSVKKIENTNNENRVYDGSTIERYSWTIIPHPTVDGSTLTHTKYKYRMNFFAPVPYWYTSGSMSTPNTATSFIFYQHGFYSDPKFRFGYFDPEKKSVHENPKIDLFSVSETLKVINGGYTFHIKGTKLSHVYLFVNGKVVRQLLFTDKHGYLEIFLTKQEVINAGYVDNSITIILENPRGYIMSAPISVDIAKPSMRALIDSTVPDPNNITQTPREMRYVNMKIFSFTDVRGYQYRIGKINATWDDPNNSVIRSSTISSSNISDGYRNHIMDLTIEFGSDFPEIFPTLFDGTWAVLIRRQASSGAPDFTDVYAAPIVFERTKPVTTMSYLGDYGIDPQRKASEIVNVKCNIYPEV